MRQRRTFSKEFKKEAVALLEDGTRTYREVAEQLGISYSQLRKWKQKLADEGEDAFRGQGNRTAAEAEVHLLREEVRRLKEENENPKKGKRVLRKAPQVKYAFIKAHRFEFTIKTMCRVLEVAPQGYYQWLKQLPSYRRVMRERLRIHIRAEFSRFKGRYGSRRIHRELREQGVLCSRGCVERLMREEGLKARAGRKYRATTNSRHKQPVAPNLVMRKFSPAKINQIWAGDITCIWTSQGWVYLSVILDLHSRRVVGWSVSARMNSELVCKSFTRAAARRSQSPGVIMHSDQGVQYASRDFRRLLQRYGAKQSMSRKGDCWDNAVVESFFHSLKVEAINGLRLQSRREVEQEVFDYIERFYNKVRRHSTLGYLSPENYERVMLTGTQKA